MGKKKIDLCSNFFRVDLNAKKPVENTNSKGQSEQKEPQDKQSMHSSTAIGFANHNPPLFFPIFFLGDLVGEALPMEIMSVLAALAAVYTKRCVLQNCYCKAFLPSHLYVGIGVVATQRSTQLRDGMSAAHPLDSLPSDANTAASIRSSISGLPEHIATQVAPARVSLTVVQRCVCVHQSGACDHGVVDTGVQRAQLRSDRAETGGVHGRQSPLESNEAVAERERREQRARNGRRVW